MTLPKMKLTFTRREVARLHEEIGDIPRSLVGPKLMALYRRLDSLTGIEWTPEKLPKKRKRK